MRAGRLRDLIDIHDTTATQSTVSGEMQSTWTTFSSDIWCEVKNVREGEFFAGRSLPERLVRTTKIFSIRHTTGIDTTMRIVYDGANYDIKSIENVDERDRELRLLGEKVE